MKVRKYEASNMQEAFLKIKADLGNDAVILHTKKFIKGGIFGLFAKERIEVIAASDMSPPDSNFVQDVKERFNSLQSELKEVKSFIHLLLKQVKPQTSAPYFPEHLEEWFLKLLQNEVEEKLAIKIMREIQEECSRTTDTEAVRNALIQKVTKIFGKPKPIITEDVKQKVVALIGPTGVGKTTTIVKLAAQFVLGGEKKIALATADTYRIAAIEQLKTYAEIISEITEIPIEIAFVPDELRKGIEKQRDKHLILIDTAGRSQKNTSQLQELKDFLESAKPDETHLVLSATTKYKDLLDIVEKFSIVQIDCLLFTKLDETTNFGAMLNIASKLNKPISYITTGQSVPQDIEVFNPEKLSKLVLGETTGDIYA